MLPPNPKELLSASVRPCASRPPPSPRMCAPPASSLPLEKFLVPGSHLAGRHPDKVLDAKVNTIAAEGPPGCVIITDGRIWHGTGSNQTDMDRNAILITYCGPQFRPQENYTVGTRLDVLSNASDRLRELLGLRVWCGYGRTGDPTVDFVDPAAEKIGELKLD